MKSRILLVLLSALFLVGCGNNSNQNLTENSMQTESETGSEVDSGIETSKDSETETATNSETNTSSESTTNSEADTNSESATNSEADKNSESATNSEADKNSESTTNSEADKNSESATNSETDTNSESVTNSEQNTNSEQVKDSENSKQETNTGVSTEPTTEKDTESNTGANTGNDSYSGMRDITTMELVQEMGIGINLGNTYESYGDWIEQWGAGGWPSGTVEAYETAWGSPVITQKIIQGYADEGFGVLRIPVHWMNLMSEDYTLSKEYIEAVREVVDWALEADLYVIINIHHDEDGFFANFPTDKENCMAAYVRVWEQIADAFRNYDDHLVFEALNEEGGWDSVWNRWGGTTGKAEAYAILNDINQAFVDTVRASGGNNEVRHLMISGYFTDVELTCDTLFKMPEDPANHCAVTVHYYTPSTFTILEEDASWGTCRTTWGTDADYAELEKLMNLLQTTFVKKDIPVIIGEYGCTKKNKEAESVRRYIASVCEAALKRDICPILWDTTNLHYNRTTCKMVDQELKKQLCEIAAKYK